MSSLIKQNQFKLSTSQVIENHITVKTACEVTGYNGQYLRRLLRAGRMEAIKIGQVWLINLVSLENYLAVQSTSKDRRFGPR